MRRVLIAVLRDLRASFGRTLAVALLLAAAVAVYVGIYAATDSLFATRDNLYREGNLAELEVIFVPEDSANVPDLSALEGVAEAQQRLILPGNMPLDEPRQAGPGGTDRLPAALFFLDERWPQTVNSLEILEGRPLDPHRPDGALIERAMATYHGLGTGDRIEVRVGHKRYPLVVEGVVLSPEFLMTSSSPTFLIPAKGSLAVVYTSIRQIEDAMGFRLINSVALRLAPGADPRAVRRQVEAALEGRVRLEEVTPRESQLAYRYLQLDLDAFKQYVPAILVVFSLVSVLATFLTVARLLHSRRQEIGTLLAIGYSPRQLAGAYVAALLLVGAAGIAIGLAGAFPLRDIFASEYARAVGFPRLDQVMPAPRVAGGVLGGLAITLLATAIPLGRILRLSPMEALRPAPAAAGPAAEASAADGPSSRPLLALSLSVRYGLRSLRRHRLMSATTIVCMGLSLAVAIAYFLSMTSMYGAVDSYLGGAGWSLAIDLHAPLWPEDVERIASVEGLEKVETQVRGQVRVRLAGDGERFDSTLTGVEPGASLWRYPSKAGKSVGELGDGEVILETILAEKLGARVGDTVVVEHLGEELEATVAGIIAGLTGESSFALDSCARRVLDLEDMSTALMAKLDPGVADEDEVMAALYDDPDVAQVTLRSGVSEAFFAIMDEFWAIVGVAAALAIGVAILFVVTSLTLTVLEREGEFATLETLGFGRGELRRILFTEAGVQMVLAVAVAVPAAWLIADYLNARMSAVWFEATTVGRARDFLAILAPALVLCPVGALPGLAHVFKLDIAETVRQKTAD